MNTNTNMDMDMDMDMEDFQEKMNPTHRSQLCGMLRVKVLPRQLLEQYVQVKRLLDRIDGNLCPGCLAMMVVKTIAPVAVDPSDEQAVEAKAERATGGQDAVGPKVGAVLSGPGSTEDKDATLQAMADETAKPVGQLDESDNKVIEEAVEPPVSGATGQAKEETTGGVKYWAPGMPVRVLQEDELKPGKIVSIKMPELLSTKPVELIIELENGETVTVEENAVDAV